MTPDFQGASVMSEQPAQPIWEPTPEQMYSSVLHKFQQFVEAKRGLDFGEPGQDAYREIFTWSVGFDYENVLEEGQRPEQRPGWTPNTTEDFLSDVWDFTGVIGERGPVVMEKIDHAPYYRFFPDSKVNYTENILDYWIKNPDEIAIIYSHQGDNVIKWTGRTLCEKVSQWEQALRAQGIKKGDCIALNTTYTLDVVALTLAAAMIGAPLIFAGTEMELVAITKRFQQADPKLLISIDGFKHKNRILNHMLAENSGRPDRPLEKRLCVEKLQKNLPTVEDTWILPYANGETANTENLSNTHDAYAIVNGFVSKPLEFEEHDFDDILYYLFTSASTGTSKGLAHSHGRMVVRHKGEAINMNFCPGKIYLQDTVISWMMMPYHVSALGSGTTIMIYDGDYMYPKPETQLQFAHDHGCTHFVTSAAKVKGWHEAGLDLRKIDLSLDMFECFGYTGGALAAPMFTWISECIVSGIPIYSCSGGTDGNFIAVGPNAYSPVFAGQIVGPMLGTKAENLSEDSKSLAPGVRGELCFTAPFVSMPVYLLQDPGAKRLGKEYFLAHEVNDRGYPIWGHEDKMTFVVDLSSQSHNLDIQCGQIVIYGRSGLTHNKHNLRSEPYDIYNELDKKLPAEYKAMIRERASLNFFVGDDNQIAFFVALKNGSTDFPQALKEQIIRVVSENIGSYAVPDHFVALPAFPETPSGKEIAKVLNKVLNEEMPDDPDTYIAKDHEGNPISGEDMINTIYGWAVKKRAELLDQRPQPKLENG